MVRNGLFILVTKKNHLELVENMKKIRLSLALFLLATICFRLLHVDHADDKRAYERYVRKSGLGRVKQQKKLAKEDECKIPTSQSRPSQ